MVSIYRLIYLVQFHQHLPFPTGNSSLLHALKMIIKCITLVVLCTQTNVGPIHATRDSAGKKNKHLGFKWSKTVLFRVLVGRKLYSEFVPFSLQLGFHRGVGNRNFPPQGPVPSPLPPPKGKKLTNSYDGLRVIHKGRNGPFLCTYLR